MIRLIFQKNNITNLSKNKTSKKGEGGKGENLGSVYKIESYRLKR